MNKPIYRENGQPFGYLIDGMLCDLAQNELAKVDEAGKAIDNSGRHIGDVKHDLFYPRSTLRPKRVTPVRSAATSKMPKVRRARRS